MLGVVGVILYSPKVILHGGQISGFKVDAKALRVEELVELNLGGGRLGRALRISIAAFHLLTCRLLSYLAVTGPCEIVRTSL